MKNEPSIKKIEDFRIPITGSPINIKPDADAYLQTWKVSIENKVNKAQTTKIADGYLRQVFYTVIKNAKLWTACGSDGKHMFW